MTGASQARRRRPADQLEIVAVDRGRHASYSACGIPYWIGGVLGSEEDLITRTVAEFRDKQDIEVRLRHEAVGLDLDRGEVTVRDLDAGRELRLGFDQLVLGLGAVPVRPDIPGIDATGVYGVQTLDDGDAVLGLGITLLRGEEVTGILTGPDRTVQAVATAGREIPADVVVLGLGVRPNTELPRDAGVRVGVTGGVVTDLRMRTASHPQV